MKFSVYQIVRAHLLTLREADSNSPSAWELTQFYVFPFIFSSIAFGLCAKLDTEFYSVSVSIFSIFCALLLSVQVALYSILRDRLSLPDDPLEKEIEVRRHREERVLLRELNSNISYLILLSCIGVTIFLIFVAVDAYEVAQSAFFLYFYSHFFLTVLMVLKRAHAVFDIQYR